MCARASVRRKARRGAATTAELINDFWAGPCMTIDQLDALLALVEHGTTGRAATALRITQSAVSKRVAALENDVGKPLLEKDGRRVRLTTQGERFVRRMRGPLGDLKSALSLEDSAPRGTVSISVSESVLSSWGAGLLAVAARSVPGLVLQPHAHRSPVARTML